MTYRILTGSLLAVLVSVPAAAQTDADRVAKLELELEMQSMAPMRAQAVVESKITQGRPYSAEATTEFVQVLGDGNRISRKTTVRIFRDGEGRTRREELGAGDLVQSVSIYDPVAHVTYVFNPSTRVAHKSDIRIVHPEGWTIATYGSTEHAAAVKQKAEVDAIGGKIMLVAPDAVPPGFTEAMEKHKAEDAAKATMEAGARGRGGRGMMTAGVRVDNPLEKTTKEVLGQQVIGGVTADGIRATTVIAAGAIGNEQEIKIVSEEWRSTELQVLVMTRHSDPRSGETTYRLSNIVRAEPGAGLFDVPADFTIRDMSKGR
jgi:hypothetical protein